MTPLEQFLVGIIGGGTLATLVTFFVTRHDNKKALTKVVNELRQDVTRLQLLILIKDYPEEEHKIMQTAQRYFVEQGGNWWTGSMFSEYCKSRDIEIPKWFKGN